MERNPGSKNSNFNAIWRENNAEMIIFATWEITCVIGDA